VQSTDEPAGNRVIEEGVEVGEIIANVSMNDVIKQFEACFLTGVNFTS
jgi:hypothetical protein